MDRQVAYLIFLAGTPLWVFLTHFSVSRPFLFAARKVSPLWIGTSSILIFSFVTLCIAWKIRLRFVAGTEEFLWDATYGAIVFTALAFSYFQLFAMTETSRRTRILRELYLRGSMTLKEFQLEYGPAAMLSVRLQRMVTLGQLRRWGARYQVKGRHLLWVGKIMSAWARVLGYSERRGF